MSRGSKSVGFALPSVAREIVRRERLTFTASSAGSNAMAAATVCRRQSGSAGATAAEVASEAGIFANLYSKSFGYPTTIWCDGAKGANHQSLESNADFSQAL
jgi:hypothetical protein